MKPRFDPLFLPDGNATDALAARFARMVRAGDVLLLEGQIGAGKTHFARALIRSLLGENEDVPSPTYTLVQTYDAPEFEIWHADLYRLGHPDEAIELGLLDAFQTAVCLIEWPERLEQDRPKQSLTLQFSPHDEGRRVEFVTEDEAWAARIEKEFYVHR